MVPKSAQRKKPFAALKNYNTFKIGGAAEELYEVYESEALMRLWDLYGSKCVLLGRGSNVLISDKGIKGVTIAVRTEDISFENGVCIADSGVCIALLAKKFLTKGLSGLEWACSIPGTVGGAVKMNAGAFGGSVAECVHWVEVYRQGKLERISAEACGFGYRSSSLDPDSIIIRAAFRYKVCDKAVLLEVYANNIKYRRSTQPSGFSAGSVFIADEKPAGWYIDQAGLKGLKIGGAQVSQKHANFIINTGGATAENVAALIDTVKSEVKNRFKVLLKEEIKYLGDF